MAKPPQDPGSGPRIRARARGGSSSIRPEVVDALGEVERSLTEVAKWEQMLAGRAEGGPVIPALPEGYVALSTSELAQPEPEVEEIEAAEPEPAPEVPEIREIGLLDAVRDEAEREPDAEAEEVDEDADERPDAAATADALVAPLLAEFTAEDDAEEPADGSVLWAARTVDSPDAEPTHELIRRRRRNARILSWAGALILVAGAALWLVPDRSSDDDELPAVDVTNTTQSDRQLLTDELPSTTSTTSPASTTTPTTTATTKKTTATTARRSTPTPSTQPTPTTASPGTTLGLPGSPGTVNPIRTVPTAPPTTPPPTTPTTAAPLVQ
jgi:hypothetical protein